MCLAVPARVVGVDERDGSRVAQVDLGGVHRQACLDFVPETEVGDYVVVHLGFAIERLDEQAAQEALAGLEQLTSMEQVDEAEEGRSR